MILDQWLCDKTNNACPPDSDTSNTGHRANIMDRTNYGFTVNNHRSSFN